MKYEISFYIHCYFPLDFSEVELMLLLKWLKYLLNPNTSNLLRIDAQRRASLDRHYCIDQVTKKVLSINVFVLGHVMKEKVKKKEFKKSYYVISQTKIAVAKFNIIFNTILKAAFTEVSEMFYALYILVLVFGLMRSSIHRRVSLMDACTKTCVCNHTPQMALSEFRKSKSTLSQLISFPKNAEKVQREKIVNITTMLAFQE